MPVSPEDKLVGTLYKRSALVTLKKAFGFLNFGDFGANQDRERLEIVFSS